MPKGTKEKSVSVGISFKQSTLDRMDRISEETKLSRPKIIEFLTDSMIDYLEEQGTFVIPLKFVPLKEYEKFKSYEGLMDPPTMAQLLARVAGEDRPSDFSYIDEASSGMTEEELKATRKVIEEDAQKKAEEFKLRVAEVMKKKKEKAS